MINNDKFKKSSIFFSVLVIIVIFSIILFTAYSIEKSFKEIDDKSACRGYLRYDRCEYELCLYNATNSKTHLDIYNLCLNYTDDKEQEE